jgi:predicted ferric reductase
MADGPVYTVALAYVLLNAVMFAYGFVLESQRVSGIQKYTAVLARGYGYMLNLNVGLILLVASRSTMTLLRRSPLNMLIPFDMLMPTAHMVLGYVCLACGALHGLFHLIPGIAMHAWKPGFLKWTFAVSTGFGALGVLLIMSIFAAPRIRRQKFELFYYTHAVGAVLFCAVLILHGIRFEKLYTWKWVVPFIALYIIDRTCRKLQERRGYVAIDVSCSSTYANGKIIKFVIPKCLDYKAGQWAELCIPALSEFQWHPFTIASAPRETSMAFFIKTAGDWTSKLSLFLDEMKDAVSQGDSQRTFDYGRPSSRDLQCRIRGAYGAPTQHVGQFEKVVLISGGVGSTPFLSVVKDIVHHLDEKYPQPADDCFSLHDQRHDCNDSTSLPDRRRLANDVFQVESKSSKIRLTKKSIVDVVGAGHRDSYQQSPTFVSNLQRIYCFLASTTVAFLVLWLVIFRVFNTSIAVVLDQHMRIADFRGFQALPFVYQVIDMALASLIAVPTLLLIGLELVYIRHETTLAHKFVDIVIVAPVLVAPMATNILFFLHVLHDRRTAYAVLFHYALWPLTVLAMLFRHTRNGAGTTVIASSFRNDYENTRSVDFIYTTPDCGSDDWLVADLARYSSSRHFRLHRYLTRETVDEEKGPEYVGRFKSSYGRPDWDRIFEALVRSARSGSNIGVFFCGPKQMELDVREACYSAMTRSRRRGMHYGVGSGTATAVSTAGTPTFSSRSCNVRLSIRTEKF